MRASVNHRGFALIVALVLMALIVAVVVAYLGNTRSDRATSSAYANRLRAKMIADGGLAAAVKLLSDNTRYGNYVTAMPAPSPSPAPHYTEIYRPTDPTDTTHALKVDDYLTLSNAAGEVLVSRAAATPTAAPIPKVDPRPTPEVIASPIPAGDPFGLSTPTPVLSASNSFDFNQVVRVGNNNAGRLIDPDSKPAFGQWVRVRGSNDELIGRYAFFIEDESMKVNVNVAGNNLALPSPSPNLRINDLLPLPAVTPASQIQEIDPTALLRATNRKPANAALTALGVPGQRLPTKSTTALLSNWTLIEQYAHLLTTVSRDDNSTARGWQRLDLNALVAAATDNASKSALATRLANWMRDAWTGPTPLANLQYHQMFNDDRLRLQMAADIIDYIDSDNIPTDAGDVIPQGYTVAVPVIGIEKIPYLVALNVVYQASDSTCPTPPVQGNYTATVKLKLQFRFLNMYNSPLDLTDHIGTIQVKGVPVLTKNGPLTPPFDFEAETFTVKLADLKPVNGSGACDTAGACVVPAGDEQQTDSGAKTVQTDWLKTLAVSFNVEATDQNPRFQAGKLTVKVLGKNGERLDDTAITLIGNSTGYMGPDSTKDFLTDATPSKGPLQVASINLVYGTSFETGDPRYRGQLVDAKWQNINRTDSDRIANSVVDKAELNPRISGVDWYDSSNDRPLAFIRNGPMVNIGELGNIATTEYPWRTLYLQHAERPANTAQVGPKTEVPSRRSQSQDYVLVDLFRAGGGISRSGALNINTQQQYLWAGSTTATLPLQSLFLGATINASPAPEVLTRAAPAAAPSPADRLSTSVNVLVNSTTVAPSGSNTAGTAPLSYRIASVSNKRLALPGESVTPDNNPTRPYFQLGELAPTLSRLLSASEASDTSSNSSKVVYSALRDTPQGTTGKDGYKRDFQIEQVFRDVSNSITTRGNVFRVLYVGQAIKDINKNKDVDPPQEVQSVYLAEAFIERVPTFAPSGVNADAVKTSDSKYRVISSRVITE